MGSLGGEGVGESPKTGQVYCTLSQGPPSPTQANGSDTSWSLDREAASESKSCTWNSSEYECFLVI